MTKNALCEKEPKKSGMGRPPPLIRAIPERKRFFLLMSSLMTTSCLVDQTGWEEKVMLTHFGMVTNGRRTSDTRKHIEDTKIP